MTLKTPMLALLLLVPMLAGFTNCLCGTTPTVAEAPPVLNGNTEASGLVGYFKTPAESIGFTLQGNNGGICVRPNPSSWCYDSADDMASVDLEMAISGFTADDPADESDKGNFVGWFDLTTTLYLGEVCIYTTWNDPPEISDMECSNDAVSGDLSDYGYDRDGSWPFEGSLTTDTETGAQTVTIVVEGWPNVIQGDVSTTGITFHFSDDYYPIGGLGATRVWSDRELLFQSPGVTADDSTLCDAVTEDGNWPLNEGIYTCP